MESEVTLNKHTWQHSPVVMQRFVVGINGDWSPAISHPLAQGQITFLLELDSSKIAKIDFELGFGHRADEKLLEVRDFRQGLSQINRAGWNTPIAPSLAYAEAAEELMGLHPPLRAVALRELVLQLQILQGQTRFLGAVLDTIDFETESAQNFRELHENLAAWNEQLTGGRLHDAFIRLGGIGSDIPNTTLLQLQQQLETLVIPEFPENPRLPEMHSPLREIVSAFSTNNLATALTAALAAGGAIDVQLPKVVKVPRGQSFRQKPTAFGRYGVWLHSDGGKSPQRLSLTPPSITALSRLQRAAIGLDLEGFKSLLLQSPISVGELER